MITVKGIGPKRPRFIIVGEAPGEHEEAQGMPFVGADGQILDRMLRAAGIDRSSCYITNVVKIRAPQSKIVNLPKLGFVVADFYPSLYEELKGIECEWCIPLGDIALNALTGKDGISKHRGSIYPSVVPGRESMTCIPTLHSGLVREMWQARGTVIHDLRKAVRIAAGGYRPFPFHTITSPDLDTTRSEIDLLGRCRAVSLDIEVVGSGQIACVGVGGIWKGERRSLCIPFKKGYLNYWSYEDEVYVWYLIRQLLLNPNILKIGQYLLYDMTVLFPFIGEMAPPWFDTNVAHHLIDPELPHTLAFMTSTYTDVNYYKDDPKDEGESWKFVSSSEQLWDYNGKDVEIPLFLEEVMTRELGELGMLEFMRGYQMSLLRTLWRMSQRGLCLDEDKRQELLQGRLAQIVAKNKELEEKVGHPLNVNSPKQMKEFVYGDLNLPIQYHRKTRKPTLNEEALNKLSARYPNPSFQLAVDIRGLVKETGTYLEVKTSEDGKVRGKYNPTGTETGRSSCSKTIFNDGLDLQNVPEDLRGMFVAGEGKVFLLCDLWQAEFYAVSIFARCQVFLSRLERGQKAYKLIGSWLFGKKEEEIDDEDRDPHSPYQMSKKITHAADYGLGPGLLAILAKCPQALAKAYLEKFHAYAPEIRGTFHAEIQRELFASRRLTTPLGRVRIFRNRLGEDMYREAYAHLPQSTIADYLHQVMVKLEYMLPSGATFVHEGFDSFIIECWPTQKEEVKGLVEKAFDKTLWWKGQPFKIPFECKEGERWK